MAKIASKPQPAGFSLGDIVYVLFKHKWKIVLTTLVACAAAGVYYFRTGPVYESQAKLMVRYIVEESPVDEVDTKVSTTGNKVSDAVIKSELEILTSWDVAMDVAYAVTGTPPPKGEGEDPLAKSEPAPAPDKVAESDSPERVQNRLRVSRIIPRSEDPVTTTEKMAAVARVISQGLVVGAERGSNVITVAFRHNDIGVPQIIVNELVEKFLKRHMEIHRSMETKQLVEQNYQYLKGTYEAKAARLNNAKAEARVTSIAETGTALAAERSRIGTELSSAEVEHKEQQARVVALKQLLGEGTLTAAAAKPAAPNPAPGTAPGPDGVTPAATQPPATPPQPDQAVVTEYRNLYASLTSLRSSYTSQLARGHLPGSGMVKGAEAEIASLDAKRARMEKQYPYLVATAAANSSAHTPLSQIDLVNETSRLSALEARIAALQKEQADMDGKIEAFFKNKPAIEQAERELKAAETKLAYIDTRKEKAEVDSLMKNHDIPNISKLQGASPALLNMSQRTKVIAGIVAGGPVLSIALVLLFGILLNRNIKRAGDLEDSVEHPLWLSIPFFSRRDRVKARLPMGASKATGLLKSSESEKAPWDQYHFMQPYAEALRDRLSSYFDATGNLRKPKLIAVTGYSVGAGVSTLAGGLAASLSEIGDGKVLLVDMNGNHGTAHPFFDGQPALSLTKALRLPPATPPVVPSLEQQGVQEKLYVARPEANSHMVSPIGLRRMMPDLKASEFDYIVFDMPPLGQTRPTAALAGLMDKVLVIVEAEANSRADVRRGCRDLVEAGADFSMIFNKSRSYGPRALVGGIS